MSKKRKVKKEHYFLFVIVLVVVVSLGVYLNVPSMVLGRGNADRTAPVITNFQMTNMTYNKSTPDAYTVNFSWTTDKVSTSWVCWTTTQPPTPTKGKLNNYYYPINFSSCGGLEDYVTNHTGGMYMVPSKTYYVVARSTDYFGNIAYSNILTITPPPLPPPDTTAPTVTITSPATNDTVTGMVNVYVNAADNVGIAQVQLKVDGVVRATDPTAPYILSWYSVNATNGSHILQATAVDAAANSGSSMQVTVFVNNISTSTATTTP